MDECELKMLIYQACQPFLEKLERTTASLERMADIVEAVRKDSVAEAAPPYAIPMILYCPTCHNQHLDEGEWETRLHKTHQCQVCKVEWRPALVPTVGVQSLT